MCQKQHFPVDFQISFNLESGNLEILDVHKNAKKYSMIDLIISFFRMLAKKVGFVTFSTFLLNIYVNPDAEKRQHPLCGTFLTYFFLYKIKVSSF